MFGGFDPRQALGFMNPLGTEDPAKMAYRSAALQLISGADPTQVMSNMPGMMMKAREQQQEQEYKKRRLAIDEAALADSSERTRLMKEVELREIEKHKSEKAFGEVFSRYDLDPQTIAPDEPHPNEPGLSSTGKSDRALPTGEEGNPQSQAIMNLPLTMRKAMAAGPLAASDELQSGLSAGMKEIFDPSSKSATIDSEVVTLMSPDGETSMSFDMKDPSQNLAGRAQMNKGWIQASPSQTVKNIQTEQKDVWQEGDTDAIKELNAKTDGAAESAEKMGQLGQLLLNDDVYTGKGGELVHSAVRYGQDWFGWFKSIDTSKPQAAQKVQSELVANLKQELFSTDRNWSNADRDFIKDMIPGMTNDKPGLARMIAMQGLKAEYQSEQRDFLRGWMEANPKKGLARARAAWKLEATKVRPRYFGEDVVQGKMQELLSKTKDKSLMEYGGDRIQDARKVGIPGVVAPQGGAPAGEGAGSWVQEEDGTWSKK